MKLAYVTLQGRGRTDALIAEVAHLLATDGVRLAGTVQSNHERPDRRKCDMDPAWWSTDATHSGCVIALTRT